MQKRIDIFYFLYSLYCFYFFLKDRLLIYKHPNEEPLHHFHGCVPEFMEQGIQAADACVQFIEVKRCAGLLEP